MRAHLWCTPRNTKIHCPEHLTAGSRRASISTHGFVGVATGAKEREREREREAGTSERRGSSSRSEEKADRRASFPARKPGEYNPRDVDSVIRVARFLIRKQCENNSTVTKMVSGGMACVKYLLFLFNLIFAVTGIVFISVGAVILVAYNGYNNFVDSWFFAAPVLMIIVGVIVFLVSFFGCCGAVKENHCMIITFSVLLLLIFALELGAGITGYMMRGEISNMLENRMNSTMRQYEENRDIRNSWDIMQHDLQCCGMNSPADWIQFGSEDNTIPESCCKELPAQGKCDANSIHLFEDGCMMRLKAAIESSALILGGVGVGIAIVQLIGVIFACCLARSIRREYETVETTAH
ncbi:PREDICTED: CD63 antigen-like isoform X1 [Dinoponera quadriceps]|uniref:CD63 antigen-like isoform X1 n=1 Tax=Dinoponera quadriceps TaxID=609295 RepID=A0A6P3XR89_DINQU|nr:PREDICTED: CD63 antigen-like isoform X1 [Dinoponera quadriceps]XP_014480565.1 PREDICTED: CD63 antigen-like isoform X1 [Dinoponera quadriceps]